MKSQLKVDFKSRYNDGEFGEKEPLIRVELVRSEDPRDTLLNEIFEKDEIFPPLAASRVKEQNGERTFFIYKKTPSQILYDVLSNVHIALNKYSGLETSFCMSSDEFYFDLLVKQLPTSPIIRSKGVSRFAQEGDPVWGATGSPESDRLKLHYSIIEKLVSDFKDFEKIVKENAQ